jgi:hypothetical protein
MEIFQKSSLSFGFIFKILKYYLVVFLLFFVGLSGYYYFFLKYKSFAIPFFSFSVVFFLVYFFELLWGVLVKHFVIQKMFERGEFIPLRDDSFCLNKINFIKIEKNTKRLDS